MACHSIHNQGWRFVNKYLINNIGWTCQPCWPTDIYFATGNAWCGIFRRNTIALDYSYAFAVTAVQGILNSHSRAF